MSQLENIRSYWNVRAESYSRQNQDELKDQRSEQILEKILSYAPKKEHLQVLDLGCGPGIFAILMAKAGHSVTAVDYSEEMIKEASQNAKEHGAEIHFERMDAQKLSFEAERFDLIVSRNMMWCLEEPKTAYREWIRVLKKGGRLLNFDGNHYLSYFDFAYKEAASQMQKESDKKHQDYIGDAVDVSQIDNIAKTLPLSREKRPDWDFSVLRGLGVSSIQTEFYDRLEVKTEGKKEIYAGNFLICAEK